MGGTFSPLMSVDWRRIVQEPGDIGSDARILTAVKLRPVWTTTQHIFVDPLSKDGSNHRFLSFSCCDSNRSRIAARAFCFHRNLSVANIFAPSFFTGLNLTWVVNYLGVELMHFALSGECWSIFSSAAQWLHQSEQEWEEYEGKNWANDWATWLGPFEPGDPLS